LSSTNVETKKDHGFGLLRPILVGFAISAILTHAGSSRVGNVVVIVLSIACLVVLALWFGRVTRSLPPSLWTKEAGEPPVSVEQVKAVLDGGGDIDARGAIGDTALMNAAFAGKTDCVKLLIDAGADINATDVNGATVLSYAAKGGSSACVALLASNGAGVGAADRLGTTPLHYAARSGSVECARFLVDHGADVNASTVVGNTPLMSAAIAGRQECVDYLISAGADVNAKTNFDYTVLMMSRRHPSIVASLKAAGARKPTIIESARRGVRRAILSPFALVSSISLSARKQAASRNSETSA